MAAAAFAANQETLETKAEAPQPARGYGGVGDLGMFGILDSSVGFAGIQGGVGFLLPVLQAKCKDSAWCRASSADVALAHLVSTWLAKPVA